MKNVYLRNSVLNRFVPLFAILLLVVLGVSVFLLTRLRTGRGGSTGRGPVAIHLVDEFNPENVEGTPQETVAMPPRAEWRFDGSTLSPSGDTGSATLGWQAGPDVNDFQVRDGRLLGRSTSDCPIIYAERTVGLDEPDLLHAMTWSDDEKLDLERKVGKIKRGAVSATTPIVANNEMKTYIIRRTWGGAIRHVLIRPTDVEGATFEIEFVRLIFRKEYRRRRLARPVENFSSNTGSEDTRSNPIPLGPSGSTLAGPRSRYCR